MILDLLTIDADESFENPVAKFSQSQKDRLLACRTPDEIGVFAKGEGVTLDPRTYEALAMYAGE